MNDKPVTPGTTRPARCLYFHGCMWNCTERCGDGREQFSPEERKQMLTDRAAEERQFEADRVATNRIIDAAFREALKDD